MENELITIFQKIIEKYDEIDRITQKDFNILFSGNVGHKETFHTYLISDLLDPTGTNKQKDKFLKLFLEVVGVNEKFESPSVFVEYEIQDRKRIDIVIKENGRVVVAIEAKIYDTDRGDQLKNYYKFTKKENAQLYYLTLFGDYPVGNGIDDIEYRVISFKDHILRWIKKCIFEVCDIPHIRDQLLMYKKTIEDLTYTNSMMGEEMSEILLGDPNKVKAATEIYERLEHSWAKIEYKFWIDLYTSVDDLLKEKGIKWEDGDDIFYKNFADSVWYKDEKMTDDEMHDEEESVRRIEKIRFENMNKNNFGIAFKKQMNDRIVYCVIEYINGSEKSWIGIEVKDLKTKKFLSGSEIIKVFGSSFNLTENDDYSIYKLLDDAPVFASKRKIRGTSELFDKRYFKNFVKNLSQDMSKLILSIEKVI